MENCINRLHRESFFNFDNEKVDNLFITLKNINWVVTFTDQNLILFTWEKLSKFSIKNCCTSILKRCI